MAAPRAGKYLTGRKLFRHRPTRPVRPRPEYLSCVRSHQNRPDWLSDWFHFLRCSSGSWRGLPWPPGRPVPITAARCGAAAGAATFNGRRHCGGAGAVSTQGFSHHTAPNENKQRENKALQRPPRRPGRAGGGRVPRERGAEDGGWAAHGISIN